MANEHKPPSSLVIRNCLCVFLYQLYSVNYPSLRDNNILRRVLVTEVMFWAEKLKRRFMEKMSDEKDAAEHQTDVGAEKEEESAGEHHNGLHTYKILYTCFKIKNYMRRLTGECGAGMDAFLEWFGGLPEDQVFWTDIPGQEDSRGQIRCSPI